VLGRTIGSGGMSTVFLGTDEVLDRHVAVKVLKRGFEESDVGSRFRREGRTAARLSHPNIVQVYDAGEDELDGREVSYIVMEYVSGGDLKQLIEREGPLSEPELSRIGADVASGLAHAHEKGVVHRDMKPQNVLLDEHGRPKLADFGIARALDSATAHSTRTGSYLGTAIYSSPEQLQGEKVTPKSDVYSLGITLYEAATGSPPFSGAPIEVASQQISKSPASPRSRGARIGPELDRLILSCLSKDPERRPSAADLRATLLQRSAVAVGAAGVSPSGAAGGLGALVKRVVGERPAQRVPGAPEQTVVLPTRTFRTGARRATLLAVAAAAVLLLLASWGAYVLLAPEPAGQAGAPAEQEPAARDAGQGAPQEEAPQEEPASDEPAQDGADEEEPPEQEEPAPEEEPREPAPDPTAAEDAVFQMYVAAATNDFEGSWGYLSERYREEVGSLEAWRERYEPVSYVQFTRAPEATVSGDEARVEFEVQETRPGGTQTVGGAWVVVSEGGEPKLDRLIEG
jgi:eukaryotic-like serine/threonine-protein kinase